MKNTQLYKILISDANIYKAILSVDSYIFNPNLMNDDDIELFYLIKDKFNYNKYFKSNNGEGLIEEIRKIIIEVIDEPNKFLSTKVYFKLKNPSKGEYRPLHVSSLKDSIAMVAMLQILIFDTDLTSFSNLSKMIPSYFYGNVPSKVPERLFERWQDKYKEYSEKANEKFSEYEKNSKYKYEVTLDLKNFFPSVNPLLVYKFIIESLNVRFSNYELELIKIVTYKLLFLKIKDYDYEEFQFFKDLYYKSSSKNGDIDEIKLKLKDEEIYITKGIPQGLPQSYFFGNLIMIEIAKIYDDFFKGEAIYYVDDSYIYTNVNINDDNENDDNFFIKLTKLNERLEKYSLLDNKELELPYNSKGNNKFKMNNAKYIIEVHTDEKSSYLNVNDTKTGYKYLKFLSRLASISSFDLKSTFDDLEKGGLKERFSILVKAIESEINLCYERIQKENNCYEESNSINKCAKCERDTKTCKYENYKEYFKKLIRFKKFFEYRILIIELEESNSTIEKLLNDLSNLTEKNVENEFEEGLLEIKLSIIEQYLVNNLDDFYNISADMEIDKLKNNKLHELSEKIKEFEVCYAKNSKLKKDIVKHDFFYYYKLFGNHRCVLFQHADLYKNLGGIISKRINSKNKQNSYQVSYLKDFFQILRKGFIVEYAFGRCDDNIKGENIGGNCQYNINENEKGSSKYEIFCFWARKSEYLKRYIANTIVSLILNVELSDNLYITRNSRKPINYFELRLVTAVRNRFLDLDLVCKILQEYFQAEQVRTLDYSIFEAIYYFRCFARNPKYIDNLILIHKYTTELWENGSKYMYFYTLHNQSHAVQLIKNINNFTKKIDYIRISQIDYYILYIACYLHDISMVMYPEQDKFLSKDWDEANSICSDFIEKFKEDELILFKQQSIKALILEMYKGIDELFEIEVRSKHAKDSANYIRKNVNLPNIDSSILDIVADISYSHGIDARDVYHVKSCAKEHLISKKFMMILIRVADLFDMSENRVSIPIFYNNKNRMPIMSRFHWISHLITSNYNILNEYEISCINKSDYNPSYFKPQSINEKIIIEIDIKLNQLTTINNNEKCDMVVMENYIGDGKIILDVNDKKKACKQEKCNFICKWFMKKNWYMINELYYLQNYLQTVQSYFKTTFQIKLNLKDSNVLRTEDFDDLKKFIENDHKK